MSLPTDMKIVSLKQFKELADEVGVSHHGSKAAIANRIQSKLNGKAKLMTLIDKTKKTVALHKEAKKKQNKQNKQKQHTEPAKKHIKDL